jgi:bifunctional polynucleotide phosphatase/kinase
MTQFSQKNLKWIETDEYIMGKTSNFVFTDKYAWFDLDSTIIIPKSGKRFPTSYTDWKFMYDNTIKILCKLHCDGYCVVIISNQSGIDTNRVKSNEWISKLNAICEKINIDIMVFCSKGKNKYRKPIPSFYYDFVDCDTRASHNRHKSFYCGDACGRHGDHSNCDIKFAYNLMINFCTPEMLFKKELLDIPKICYPNVTTMTKPQLNFTSVKQKHLVILVGYPASGKSYVAKMLNKQFGYIIVNQDTLKTKAKCIKLVKELCAQNKCVIIDNTNRDVDTRKIYIDIAKQHNYSNITAIHVYTSYELAMHRNYFRMLTTGKYISEIAYKSYKKNFTEPKLKEGYLEVITFEPSAIIDPNLFYLNYLY